MWRKLVVFDCDGVLTESRSSWEVLHEYFGSGDKFLPLIKFAYNNSYHASIGMTPYKALIGGSVDLFYVGVRWVKRS